MRLNKFARSALWVPTSLHHHLRRGGLKVPSRMPTPEDDFPMPQYDEADQAFVETLACGIAQTWHVRRDAELTTRAATQEEKEWAENCWREACRLDGREYNGRPLP
jgi:hypothetical protein